MIDQFINFVIRPPRAEYNPDQYLWERDFTLAGRTYIRQDLELTNARGHTLRCSHYLPSPFPEDASLPCVIYCHGNSGCRADANEAAVMLLPSNITVFTLDFSGSGLSDGDYVSLGWHERDDLKVVVSYLRSNKQISRIGLWGRKIKTKYTMGFSATSPTVDQGDGASISAVHPDIIMAHILTRLDGQTLASASCASSQLHAFSTEGKLWRDICSATWPSVADPRVDDLISAFPAGHRSFFSDSFPLLDNFPSRFDLSRPSSPPTTELISAVDIFYKDQLIFSKVQESETESGWFLCSPFRVDLLDPKETVPTPIRHVGEDQASLKQLEENLSLSWIVIDPTRKRAANFSSRRAVTVQRHWLTGEIQLRFATILAGEKRGEFVQCGMVVTCNWSEGGELHVREVSMQVEGMEGNHLNGKESLVILERAIEGGERRKEVKGKGRFEEYLEMKRERRERKERREKTLDMICIATGVTIFLTFWSFVFFR